MPVLHHRNRVDRTLNRSLPPRCVGLKPPSPNLTTFVVKKLSKTKAPVLMEFFSKTCNDEVVYTWNPNDPCFDWKRPCFGGLKLKNRGQVGSRYLCPIGSTFPPTRMSKSLPVFTPASCKGFFGEICSDPEIFAKHWHHATRWGVARPNVTTLRMIGPSKTGYFEDPTLAIQVLPPFHWRVLPILRGTKQKNT